MTFRPLGLPIFTKKTLITGFKNGIRHNTRNLPGRRVSTPQVDLDPTCFPFTCWKDRRKEGRLTIRKLRPVDSGLYQCVATNSLGTKKATMNLIVQSRPLGLYSARYADLYIMIKHFTERLALHHV